MPPPTPARNLYPLAANTDLHLHSHNTSAGSSSLDAAAHLRPRVWAVSSRCPCLCSYPLTAASHPCSYSYPLASDADPPLRLHKRSAGVLSMPPPICACACTRQARPHILSLSLPTLPALVPSRCCCPPCPSLVSSRCRCPHLYSFVDPSHCRVQTVEPQSESKVEDNVPPMILCSF